MHLQQWTCLGLILLLTGCLAPYNDARREAGQRDPVGQSKNDIVAICYHPWRDNVDNLQPMAQAMCASTNKTAVFKEIKTFNCSFMAPNTALFACE